MTKYLLPIAIVLVVGFAAVMFWQKHFQDAPPAICADDVRGYEETVGSSLAAAAKNLQEIGVKFNGTTSKTYIERLSQLRPTDLLALKACDTQCKLLERCLNQNPKATVSQACPTEYSDYKARVDAALKAQTKLKEYEDATKQAADHADALSTAQKQLAEVQSGVGASGGREEVLKQHVAAEQAAVEAQILAADSLAKELIGSSGAP